jgi:tetratricopeptide (TPR) repeat protein
VLRAIETKYPGQRENSLLASAELSLRRLPDWIRERIRGLSVFQGGGGRPAIGMALSLEPDQLNAIEDALLGVGLAEYVEPGYLRFDPALVGGELSEEQRAAATSAWADAMRAELGSLYEARENDANFAYNLARLELPNFLAALEFLAAHEPPEKVMGVAALLEDVAASFSATALSRVVEIRNEAAGRIGAWSHAQYLAASADVNRLLDQGRLAEAVRAAQALHAKCESAGDDAYEGAPYDGAMAESALGRVLRMLGNPVAAAGHLDRAYVRFEALNQPRMADVVLTDKADCLRDLGKYQEAAEIHQRIIARAQDRNDARMIAVGKGQLATICQLQNNLAEALRLHCESRALFESINEPRMVAIGWHQTGIAYQLAQQFERAEESYRKSLDIRVQCDDRPGQMSSLGQLGSLYTMMQRNEDAVRLYRQAVEVAVNLGDPRSKGLYHSNAAIPLIQLARYDEARKELERAVECKRPFGHVAELWKTFGAIFYLETATGNREAALAARQQAIDAYLAYRRDGGAAQIDTAPLASMGAPEDPNTDFLVAAELILILERTGSGNNQPAPAPKDSLAKKS